MRFHSALPFCRVVVLVVKFRVNPPLVCGQLCIFHVPLRLFGCHGRAQSGFSLLAHSRSIALL
jgi:hypothetical protein